MYKRLRKTPQEAEKPEKYHPEVQRGLIICCEDKPRTTKDGIEIVSAPSFAKKLWNQEYFCQATDQPLNGTITNILPLAPINL